MDNDGLLVLVGEIRESLGVLDGMNRLYKFYAENFATIDKRDLRDAVLLADILCNSYTCIETILFRIARVFENHLDPYQWHKELLRKMHLDIPNIRKAVL
jgi:hypothetical protein